MAASGPGSWDDVEDILAAAMEVPPSARPGVLDARCAGRPELRAEVLSLLANHDRAGTFLKTANPAWQVESRPIDFAGRTLGPFRLVEKVGEGGMSVVYRAERTHGDFTQRVAVKLIDAPLRDPDALRRFRTERQILATLSHPHIVSLLDGGLTEEGQPYLVMAYIEGAPITTWCAERELTLESRLRLFQELCAGVHHAHQHGVVHRDLKPGNILVTADGVPKILDFGVAKLSDASGGMRDATATGFLGPLTPNYASPEQLRGLPVTTACDVYALGALLYEILSGARAYETSGQPLDEVLRIVVEREPRRPSATGAGADGRVPYPRGRLKGDLDAIVLKAMAKEPAHRYSSAQELSDDVARHLAGRPVLARGLSFGYLAARLARRHRAAFGAAAISLLALVAAFGISLRQTQVATSERNRAQAEAAKAAQVAAFLRNLFASGAPTFTKGQKPTVEDVLEAGVTRVEKELAGQPGVQAALLATLGLVYTDRGLPARANPLLERSLALREGLAIRDEADVAESLWALGMSKRASADYEAAQRHLERALRIREEVLGADHPLLAEVLSEIGNVHFYRGRYQEGRAALERAVAIEERSGGRKLVYWLGNLSNLDMALDDQESARKHLEGALAAAIRDDGRLTVRADAAVINLGSLLRQQEDFAGARQLFERALASCEESYGPDYTGALYTRAELGELHLAMGDHGRARDYLGRAIRGTERTLGADHPALADPLTYYGRLLLAEGKPREALVPLERALRVREKALGSQLHNEVATNLVELALARARLDEIEAAEATLRQALEIQREVLVAGHRSLVPTLSALGELRAARHDPAAARTLLEEAVGIAQAKLPARHSKRLGAEAALRRLRAETIGQAQP